MNKKAIEKQIHNQKVMEFIWDSAKSNTNWTIETAKLLASMHGLDYKTVYKLGCNAKVRKKFVAKDWDIKKERITQ